MTLKALLVGFLLLGVFTFCCQTKALDEACTPPTAEETDECAIANSECDTDKCVCKTGFIEENGKCPIALGQSCTNADECVSNSKCDGTDQSKICSCADSFISKDGLCSKRMVSETDCTKDTVDQCKLTQNAECNNAESNAKCKCSDGFAEDKTDGSTCVKACPSVVECTSTGNAACTNQKCTCNDGYGEKNNVCVKTVSGTTCTDNGNECEDAIDNSQCEDGKCQCDAGYVMNVDECTKENAAVSVQVGTVMMIISAVAIVLQFF